MNDIVVFLQPYILWGFGIAWASWVLVFFSYLIRGKSSDESKENHWALFRLFFLMATPMKYLIMLLYDMNFLALMYTLSFSLCYCYFHISVFRCIRQESLVLFVWSFLEVPLVLMLTQLLSNSNIILMILVSANLILTIFFTEIIKFFIFTRGKTMLTICNIIFKPINKLRKKLDDFIFISRNKLAFHAGVSFLIIYILRSFEVQSSVIVLLSVIIFNIVFYLLSFLIHKGFRSVRVNICMLFGVLLLSSVLIVSILAFTQNPDIVYMSTNFILFYVLFLIMYSALSLVYSLMSDGKIAKLSNGTMSGLTTLITVLLNLLMHTVKVKRPDIETDGLQLIANIILIPFTLSCGLNSLMVNIKSYWEEKYNTDTESLFDGWLVLEMDIVKREHIPRKEKTHGEEYSKMRNIYKRLKQLKLRKDIYVTTLKCSHSDYGELTITSKSKKLYKDTENKETIAVVLSVNLRKEGEFTDHSLRLISW